MAIPKIQGKWLGFFTYGKSYPPVYWNKKIRFELFISNNDGLITGTCMDDLSKDLFDKPAIIEGVVDNYSVMFIKKYPCLLMENNRNELVAITDEPSKDIQYVGTIVKKLFRDRYIIKGEWDMSGSFVNEQGVAEYYTLEGKWQMEPA